MTEIWKDIEGYEGFYQISNLGNIRSLDRWVVNRAGKRQFIRGRLMKPWADSRNCYLEVTLCKNGKERKCLMHRLVASAFIPNPNNYPEVDHIDHNPKNNSVENLRWVTHKENLHNSYDTMSPVRNYRSCTLIFPDGQTMDFETVTDMRRYRDRYNLPFGGHAINYYGHSGGYELVKH